MNTKFVLAFIVCISGTVFADTIHVPVDAPTIQIAIEESHPFDTIIVSPGTYSEVISFGGKVITVQSTNPNDPNVVAATIINAGGLGSVVTFSGGEDQINTILDGFTITGGTKGIDTHNSRAVIRHCVIRDNSSSGIFQSDGVIEDCQILNNSEGLDDCDGTIRRSIIRNNRGAGLAWCDGTIFDSRIESNAYGVYGGSVDLYRCVIAENSETGVVSSGHPNEAHTGDIEQSFILGNGGNGISGGTLGLVLSSDSGLVRNTVIAGNRKAGLQYSAKNVLSCTVTGNRRYGFDAHTGTIRHVILWDNLLGPLNSSSTPLFSGAANPYFVQPGYWDQASNAWLDGDYHLSQNSPYLDTGDPAYGTNPSNPTQDIDGNPRIIGARVDIGAYEFQGLLQCDGADFDGDGISDVCDVDLDGDSIPNAGDLCEQTPLGVTVDYQGRPLADLNHDCKVNLRDFAEFQKSMSDP